MIMVVGTSVRGDGSDIIVLQIHHTISVLYDSTAQRSTKYNTVCTHIIQYVHAKLVSFKLIIKALCKIILNQILKRMYFKPANKEIDYVDMNSTSFCHKKNIILK